MAPPAPGVTRSGEARGSRGEDLACEYLQGRGYSILARNYRIRAGELDVVARDGATIVFVEVKERRNDSHGQGVDAVTLAKRRRVVLAARAFAAAHGLSEAAIRFDVVSITWAGREAKVRHDRGAFDADGD